MSRRHMFSIGAGMLAIVVLWWMMVFSPGQAKVSDANDAANEARSKQSSLEEQVKQLEDLAKQAPEIRAELGKLEKAVPATPALAAFIKNANAIADQSHVTWVSVTPNEPVAGVSATTIPVTINISGGFFEVLDYMHRLEKLPRLVVVDAVSVDSQAGDSGDPDASSAGSADELTVELTARMFTAQALPAPATDGAGTATTPDGATPTPAANSGVN